MGENSCVGSAPVRLRRCFFCLTWLWHVFVYSINPSDVLTLILDLVCPVSKLVLWIVTTFYSCSILFCVPRVGQVLSYICLAVNCCVFAVEPLLLIDSIVSLSIQNLIAESPAT